MEYKIEKGVSLTKFRRGKYAIVDEMEIGDSVVFESRLALSAARQRGSDKFPNRRYIGRTGVDGELRLFRIE